MNLIQDNWVAQLRIDKDAVILHVRTHEEFTKSNIKGAVNIDLYKAQGFINEIEKLDRSKSYYLYCHAGSRSGHACSLMQQLGFEKVYNLIGGMIEWRGDVVEANL